VEPEARVARGPELVEWELVAPELALVERELGASEARAEQVESGEVAEE
jgi:hypothetical protein